MPALGLRWNRSEKAGGRKTTLNSQDPETPRHSDQISRSDYSKPWDESPSKRAASMDIPRSSPSSHLNPRNSSRDGSPVSRPSSSSRLARLKLKSHASDTHLSARARSQEAGQHIPPVPSLPPSRQMTPKSDQQNSTAFQTAPTIITTAPTLEPESRPELARKRSRLLTFNKSKASPDMSDSSRRSEQSDRRSPSKKSRFPSFRPSRDPFADLEKLAGDRRQMQSRQAGHLNTDLSLHGRSSLSSPDGNTNSSRDEISNLDGAGQEPDSGRPSGQFSWLSRRQRNRKSLFPLLAERPVEKSNTAPPTATASPRPSTSARTPDLSRPAGPMKAESQRSLRGLNSREVGAGTPSTIASISFAPHPALLRSSSGASDRSTRSSPPLAPPESRSRHRSSTMGSNSGHSEETPPTPPFAGESGRNSTSTAGRSSFSNLFGLGRFRQGDPHSPRQSSTTNFGPSGPGSMSNSMSLSRDTISLPDREDGETAIQYLERVEDMAPRSQIPSVLSQKADEFRTAVMRSFMRKFAYFGDPLDMAIRKLLMEIDLPKETQQIDRVLQSFADRYHECNPGIFNSAGEAYFIAFSILMLQTDFFNKNNKRKMTKQDYVKNSSIEGISDDVLECFYDNIIYTPFIRVEDDQDIMQMRSKKTNRKTAKATKAAKAAIKHVPTDAVKKQHKEPLDPYTLIFESRLDTLRPSLKDFINLEDPYTYLGSLPIFDRRVLRQSKIGVIQIESARSRPDAFMSQSGIENPAEAKVGLVDLPIDKVGVLWRKDPKKKTARSPWQEWGAILTGAGLYFFRNAGWVKNYLHQYESHIKHGGAGTLCFFKPPISQFKPDYRLPTDHGVALQDATYKRHKNAFCFFSHNGQEVFLADSDTELNDWLAKLNHQAACKTAGIGPRGLIGGQYTGQRQRAIRRLEPNTASATQTVQTSTGEVTIQRGQIDQTLAKQISEARKASISEKIKEAEAKLDIANKQLEDELRDARHLLILAPIQLKTREQLVLAAERAQEKLDALRVEKWRLDCHRDILNLDLEEEQREAERWQARIDKLSGKSSNTLDSDVGLKINGSDQQPAKSKGADKRKRLSIKSPKHTPKLSQDSLATADDSEDFHTPPEGLTPTNFSPPHTPGMPPVSPTGTSDTTQPKSPSLLTQRMSATSNYSHTSRQQPRGPRPSLDTSTDPASVVDTHLNADDETDTIRSELGDVPEDEPLSSSRPVTPITPRSAKDDADGKPSPSVSTPDRGRGRRVSFSRRGESHHRHHIRQLSRKGASDANKEDKEDNSDGASLTPGLTSQSNASTKSEKQKDDEPTGLVRDKALFTVHGKKASVVTLGGDWAGSSPEETLQRLKAAAAATPSSSLQTPSASLSTSKSPLSRMTSAAEDELHSATQNGDAEKTPTPESPAMTFDRVDYTTTHPPRTSSLKSRERSKTGSVRTASSAAMSTKSAETVIDETTPRKIDATAIPT